MTSATVANNSKEMSAISDFPPPKDAPNYLPHNKLYEIVHIYVKHFDVLRHMRFHHEVTSIRQADDYDASGRWVVTAKNLLTGRATTDTYDGVFLCTGQFGYPHRARFPGQDGFKGRVMHTKELRTFEGFRGQRVVVVGIGCSGVDAATETSNVAEQVREIIFVIYYVSLGAWCTLNRQ